MRKLTAEQRRTLDRLSLQELETLSRLVTQSKETYQTFFGKRKTTRAESAEAVLLAYVPALIADCRAALE